MPTYACHTCKIKFFVHDRLGRVCQKCRKAMAIVAQEGALGVVGAYRVEENTGSPMIVIRSAPKYNGQLVLALIDGATIKWKGAAIDDKNQRAFLGDMTVSETDKTEYKKQEGERQNAENLHEKGNDNEKAYAAKNKRLCMVQDYEPNTDGQLEKIRTALASVASLGPHFKLQIVAHHDPDTQRLAGMKPETWAAVIGRWSQAKNLARITLIGCHTAGEADSAEAALKIATMDSFASNLHSSLGQTQQIFTEVAGYTSYIRIRGLGNRETRFDPKGGYQQKAAGSKIRFYWDAHRKPARALVYKE